MPGSQDPPSGAEPPRVDPAVVIAAIQEQVNRVELPQWPVFTLANADAPGWLCGVGGFPPEVDVIRLDYRPPRAAQRLVVQCEPLGCRSDPQPKAPDVAGVFTRLHDDDDEGEPLRVRPISMQDVPFRGPDPRMVPNDREVTIDGRRGGAVRYVEGDVCLYVTASRVYPVDPPDLDDPKFWTEPSSLILVAARGVDLGRVVLQRVLDLGPAKRERARVVDEFLASQPWPPPPYR